QQSRRGARGLDELDGERKPRRRETARQRDRRDPGEAPGRAQRGVARRREPLGGGRGRRRREERVVRREHLHDLLSEGEPRTVGAEVGDGGDRQPPLDELADLRPYWSAYLANNGSWKAAASDSRT